MPAHAPGYDNCFTAYTKHPSLASSLATILLHWSLPSDDVWVEPYSEDSHDLDLLFSVGSMAVLMQRRTLLGVPCYQDEDGSWVHHLLPPLEAVRNLYRVLENNRCLRYAGQLLDTSGVTSAQLNLAMLHPYVDM